MIEQEHRPTPLFELHQEARGKMIDFAGYRLPYQLPPIMAHRVLPEFQDNTDKTTIRR